jgi:hypothetical protein
MMIRIPATMLATTMGSPLVSESPGTDSHVLGEANTSALVETVEAADTELDAAIESKPGNVVQDLTIELGDDEEWGDHLEAEFHKLAVAEALEEIKPKEQQRLDYLTELRNKPTTPRSAEEILLELKHWRVTKQLLSIFSDYASVIGPQSHSEKRPNA